MIEICAIGGYSETGKNSVAIKIDEEVFIIDMGLQMENYIQNTEDREDSSSKSYRELLKVGAVPDYSFIDKWKDQVKAIIPSHGHLDHMGAVPFAAGLFPKAPVYCVPYTREILRSTLMDDHISMPNKIISLNQNLVHKLTKHVSLEFVHVTHSIPQTSIVVLHTPYGKIAYACDYKFDPHPALGKNPNLDRLKELGKEGVKLLIVECLYAHDAKKTPSEAMAQQMLKDVLDGTNSEGKAVLVTTFSSHLARLKSIVEQGHHLKREVLLLGRSLVKYIKAGERINLVHLSKKARLIGQRDKVAQALKRVMKEGPEKFLLVVTGHQGEPKAILTRMVKEEFPFRFKKGDLVVFSCSVIPVELNQKNRESLESQLQAKGVRIFRDIHVSGHASREDHRDLLTFLHPQFVLPAHSTLDRAKHIASLAFEEGYTTDQVLMMEDGMFRTLK
ncbi:RNase J family beta-CASP ribonuclease [Candidatus Woesearchaeota archaeon]|nr:RNase J family beta-CASP ribonuclease [Candidatus Woesearchaeota archaeon]